MKVFQSLILLLSTCFLGQAQVNLVSNPDFETFSTCPNTVAQVSYAVPWFDATNSTPDYFNGCGSSTIVDVPQNFAGYQNARSGQGYVGMVVYLESSQFRDYVEAPLVNPLQAGKRYCVTFYVNLGDTSKYAIDALGAYFSNSSITCNPPGCVLNFIPQVSNPVNNIITDTANWVKVSGSFIAVGGEAFITIGNFKDDASTNTQVVYGSSPQTASYYLIDDVSVVEVSNADAGNSSSICLGDSVQIGSTSIVGTSYSWSPASGLNDANGSNPMAAPSVTTTYTLYQQQCDVSTSASVTVTVDNCDSNTVFIPSAFSPNGDGENDFLFVRSNKNLENLDFRIYDRWGELVFQTSDITKGWDGTYQSEDLNTGVFCFYLSATISGKTVSKKGDISLIR